MEQLIQAIRFNNGKFPRRELEQMIEQKEEAIPYLLQIMVNLREDYKSVVQPNQIDFIYAYHLLAQFRVQELFPIMIDILSKPSGICDEIFDDAITENIGRVLASTYNGDIELLKRLVENTEANEYARGQALVALVALVYDGQLSREYVLEYFKQLMNARPAESSYYFNSEIVNCSVDLYPEEVYEDIKRFYDDEMVEESFIGMDSVDETLERSKEDIIASNQANHQYQLIADTIKELQTWACFQQDDFQKSYGGAFNQPKRNLKVEKIGRNEPCTCGSGKKYKKCCGG